MNPALHFSPCGAGSPERGTGEPEENSKLKQQINADKGGGEATRISSSELLVL